MSNPSGLLVALFAGGVQEELAESGLGVEHVNELVVRLARKLLKDGHRLAFGGTLGDKRHEALTRSLIDAALGWAEQADMKDTKSGHTEVTKPATWPLVNHSAWPFHYSISDQLRAELVGICRFINVDPPSVDRSELKDASKDWIKKPKGLVYVAHALTAMRDHASKDTDMRILCGGRINGARGWMAGILEEVAFTIQYEKPVLILGGFGGCGSVLAQYLSKSDAPWPDPLSLAASADKLRDDSLTTVQRQDLQNRFDVIKQILSGYRYRLHTLDTLHGISCKQLRAALTEDSTRRVIGTAARVVQQHVTYLRSGN